MKIILYNFINFLEKYENPNEIKKIKIPMLFLLIYF